MGININFQMKESLQFMEKRLIKVPRRKFIMFGLSLMISSLVCHFWLFQAPFVYATFIAGVAYVVYNIGYILYNKIYIFFHK